MAASSPFPRPDSTAMFFMTTQTEIDEQEEPNNTENFIIVWLDGAVDKSTDNDKLKTQIRSVVNCLKTFDRIHECIEYVKQIKDEKIYFIVSGSFGERVVPEIEHITAVEAIYIFCADKNKHEQWAKSCQKVCGTFNDIGIICDYLKRDIQQCSGNLFSFVTIPTIDGVLDANLNKQEALFMYLILIKDIFIKMKNEATVRELLNVQEEMVRFFRLQYIGNTIGLQLIDQFENNYCPQASLSWYTRCRFIYDTLNKALRTLNIDSLYKMRFLISDLHEHLNRLYLESPSTSSLNTVYRGQAIAKTEFEKLNSNRGGLLSINNFLSTTTDCQVALGYAMSNVGRPGFIPVLFEIELDKTVKSNSPFASIRNLSHFEKENEVLFSIASVFRIKSVEPLNDDIWSVSLELTDAEDRDLRKLTDHMRKEVNRTNNLASLGVLMLKMGDFERSTSFFKILLDNMTLQSDIHGLSMLYSDIGVGYQEKGDYAKALDFYQKSIDILLPSPESIQREHPDDSLLSGTYNNIGMVHKANGDYKAALKYITEAVECEQNSSRNQQLVATYYQNIGMLYDDQAKYSEALEVFQTALDIALNNLPPQHPVVTAIYSNIGSVYYNQNNFEEALKMFNKALELDMLSLTPTHISLAFNYNNIAFAQYGLEKHNEALMNMTKSVDITLKTLPPDHPLAIERRAALEMMNENYEAPMVNLFCEQYIGNMAKLS